MSDTRVLRPAEAAKYLGLKRGTLEKMRSRGTGPRFVLLGRRAIGYTRDDLDAWINARRRTRRGTDDD